MLTHDEINECIDRAIMNVVSIEGPEKVKDILDILSSNETLSKVIHAMTIEVSMASTFKGLELHEKEQSILTIKDGIPSLVYDKGQQLLAVVVPNKGKYFMAGSDMEINIKPDCWYDIPMFKQQEKKIEIAQHVPT